MAAAVVQTGFLGDMVLTTPLLARLAARGPVHVVATPASAPLLAGHPAVTSVLVYDKRGADRGAAGLWRVIGEGQRPRLDRHQGEVARRQVRARSWDLAT